MSYYDVLGVSETADDQAIVAAYRQKAQESLMDTEAYDLVQTAYETLSSPEKRQVYDSELRNAVAEPTSDVTVSRPGTAPLRRAFRSDRGGTDDATRAFQPVICAICSHPNSAGETYCAECGFLLTTVLDAADEAFAAAATVGPRLESSTGHVYTIKAGLNKVGREHADILILDKTVSRYHAVLVFDEERHLFSVEDAGSSNGTKVNSTLLPPRSSHQLDDGDEIAFGTTKFHLYTGIPVTPAEKGSATDDDGNRRIEITLPPTGAPPAAKLILQRGKGPQEVLLSHGTISIGRLPDNQISLAGDRYASGHHAQIVVEENIFRLIDVGSTNGSFLNGLRLTTNESIAMSDGDEIMIGSTVFQFQKIAKPSVDTVDSPVEEIVPDDSGHYPLADSLPTDSD